MRYNHASAGLADVWHAVPGYVGVLGTGLSSPHRLLRCRPQYEFFLRAAENQSKSGYCENVILRNERPNVDDAMFLRYPSLELLRMSQDIYVCPIW